MQKDRNTRIELSPLAHTALLAESATMRIKPKALLEELIFRGISDKTRAFVGIDERGLLPGLAAKSQSGGSPTDTKRLKPRIDKTPELVETVKDLWALGIRTEREIGEKIGYPHSSVGVALKRMKESGVLK